MKIEYFHASRFGNGAEVAEEFKTQMVAKGVDVEVHHISEVAPTQVAPADLYQFSSPGRFGKPIRGMRRFLQALNLPAGTQYAVLTTEATPRQNKTGTMPTEEKLVRSGQRIRPVIKEILREKGLVEIAEEKVYVTKLKGPLEEGWQEKVAQFADRLPNGLGVATPGPPTPHPDRRASGLRASQGRDFGPCVHRLTRVNIRQDD